MLLLCYVCSYTIWLLAALEGRAKASFLLFKIFYLFIYVLMYTCMYVCILAKEEGREKEERNIDWLPLKHTMTRTKPTTLACALTENSTGGPSLCRITPKQLSHIGQGTKAF